MTSRSGDDILEAAPVWWYLFLFESIAATGNQRKYMEIGVKRQLHGDKYTVIALLLGSAPHGERSDRHIVYNT